MAGNGLLRVCVELTQAYCRFKIARGGGQRDRPAIELQLATAAALTPCAKLCTRHPVCRDALMADDDGRIDGRRKSLLLPVSQNW